MDIDNLPDSMKLNFLEKGSGLYVAFFPYGEWYIIGPDPRHNTFTIAFVLYSEDEKDNKTYEVDNTTRTLRASKYVAQKFHVEKLIPELVRAIEVEQSCQQSM